MTTSTDTTTADTYTCPYCRQTSAGAGSSCPACGAPVNVRLRTTSGGWTELPAIADMTRIQAGQSSVEIQGTVSAVAEWNLTAGDALYFPHHVLLWQEPSVQVSNLPLSKPWTRHKAGLPLVMAQAQGPGRIAFSHDSAGEIVAIPVQAGASVDVCEHKMLVASAGVGYDWNESGIWYSASGASDQGAGVGLLRMGLNVAGVEERNENNQTEWHYPMGQYLDRFTAGDRPGLVLVGAGGNAFSRVLAEGETILVKPPAVLFKDPSVGMQLHIEYPSAGMKFWRSWGNRYLWLRLWGPGRVGLESCYPAAADPGTDFQSMSNSTQHAW